MRPAYKIVFGPEDLVVNADRTLWWPRQKTLFATDLHAGKAEHLRRYGSALPGGSLQTDLKRLDKAAQKYRPERLIFLGDLFHSDINSEWEVFAEWSRERPYNVELVRGNHDRFLSDGVLIDAGITVHAEAYTIEPFTLRHHPVIKTTGDELTLAGHIHPVMWVSGQGTDHLRLACFWLQPKQLILPAFGSFTGGFSINRLPRVGAFCCSPDFQSILPVPGTFS